MYKNDYKCFKSINRHLKNSYILHFIQKELAASPQNGEAEKDGKPVPANNRYAAARSLKIKSQHTLKKLLPVSF